MQYSLGVSVMIVTDMSVLVGVCIVASGFPTELAISICVDGVAK